MDDALYMQWRLKLAPIIYDWFSHHNLPWPTQACRWGQLVEESSYKTRFRVYYSEQTDNTEPQKLIVAVADVCKPHVASSEVVSSWTEFQKCPYIKDHKVIFHPGEVNKIREIPQHPELVVTHTDDPNLYLWNVEKQPSRSREKGKGQGAPDSVADLKLTGHEDDALFPLATSSLAPFVASGGNDQMVLLWSIQDSMETLLAGSSGGSAGQKKEPELAARTKLKGHWATVEDVVFKPSSTEMLVSVGDDHQILFWDTRVGTAPVIAVEQAHGRSVDIQCVDWSVKSEQLVATGAQDGSLKIWDARKVGVAKDCLFTFKVHTGGIIRLEWHPHEQGVLASGGEDKAIMVWKINPSKASEPPEPKRAKVSGGVQQPPELIFQHAGHRRGKVVDFQWNPHASCKWAMLSVSDDTADEETGGGSLQMWRMNDMIYCDEAEVMAELEKHRDFILTGHKAPDIKVLPVERSQEDIAAAAAAADAAAAAAAADAAEAPASADGSPTPRGASPSIKQEQSAGPVSVTDANGDMDSTPEPAPAATALPLGAAAVQPEEQAAVQLAVQAAMQPEEQAAAQLAAQPAAPAEASGAAAEAAAPNAAPQPATAAAPAAESAEQAAAAAESGPTAMEVDEGPAGQADQAGAPAAPADAPAADTSAPTEVQ